MSYDKKKYKGKTVIEINAKCSDMFSHRIFTKDGELYREYSGYVPSYMPDNFGGDYIGLDIDPYTGIILNWTKWKRAKKSKSNLKRGNK
jgi:hypothetical protein